MGDPAAPSESKSEQGISFSAPPSASSSSSPSPSSNWRALAATVFQGATTLSVQIGALYFANKRIDDAFTALIERGVWLPFVLLVGTVIAIVAPLTFRTVTDAAKALLPKRGD